MRHFFQCNVIGSPEDSMDGRQDLGLAPFFLRCTTVRGGVDFEGVCSSRRAASSQGTSSFRRSGSGPGLRSLDCLDFLVIRKGFHFGPDFPCPRRDSNQYTSTMGADIQRVALSSLSRVHPRPRLAPNFAFLGLHSILRARYSSNERGRSTGLLRLTAGESLNVSGRRMKSGSSVISRSRISSSE